MKPKPKTKIIVTKKVRIPKMLKGRVEERWLKNLDVLAKADQKAGFPQSVYETDPERVKREADRQRLQELISGVKDT